jgi:hypothetical protein
VGKGLAAGRLGMWRIVWAECAGAIRCRDGDQGLVPHSARHARRLVATACQNDCFVGSRHSRASSQPANRCGALLLSLFSAALARCTTAIGMAQRWQSRLVLAATPALNVALSLTHSPPHGHRGAKWCTAEGAPSGPRQELSKAPICCAQACPSMCPHKS